MATVRAASRKLVLESGSGPTRSAAFLVAGLERRAESTGAELFEEIVVPGLPWHP